MKLGSWDGSEVSDLESSLLDLCGVGRSTEWPSNTRKVMMPFQYNRPVITQAPS